MNETFPKLVDRPSTAAALVARHSRPVLSVTGDLETVISTIANPRNADSGSLVFIRANGAKSARLLAETRASVIILDSDDAPAPGRCHIRVAEPTAWFTAAMLLLFDAPYAAAIHQTAHIDATAKIGGNCRIGAFSVIEAHVEIGPDTTIGHHVVIRAGSVIGARSVIQHHVTIGGEGVAFDRDKAGDWYFVEHHGRAIIGDDVAIGSQSVIVRGMLQDTVIGRGSKIGNFANIGHNCEIGENCWLSSNVLLCGAARLEPDVRLAASVSISDHVTIGRGTRVGLGSVVTKDAPPGSVLFGNPARPLRTMRSF